MDTKSPKQEVLHIGKVTDERLAELRHENKDMKVIVVKVSETEWSYGYIRKYQIHSLEKAWRMSSTEGTLTAGRFLLQQLWIEGDKRMNSIDPADVDITATAAHEVSKLFEFLDGEIKNA